MLKQGLKQLLPVWAAFVVLAAIYIWAIPPLEGSDEYEHFAHVAWLAEGRGFPPQGAAAWQTPVRQEAGQPPLYYGLASLPARLVGTDPPLAYRPNPHFQFELDPVLPDNKNTAVHYPADTDPLRGSYLALYLARIVSLLSGVMLIGCVYGLALTVMGASRMSLAAAWFVAMMPQVVFHSSHVSNDILATAFCSLTLWLAGRMARQGLTLGRAAGVGLAFGLAALTKVNAFVIGLPLLIAWLWFWFAYREQRRRVLAAGAVLTLVFTAVAGWWYARNWLWYSSPFGLDTHCYQQTAHCSGVIWRWPLWLQWRDVFRSFWAAFGLANIRPYDWVYLLFAALMLLALAGLAWGLRRWWRQGRRFSATAVLVLMLGSAVAASLLLLEYWLQQLLATYGRLLYPALGAFVVLLVFGLWRLHPRLGQWAWLLPAVLAWAAPFWLIRPAFLPPPLLPAAQVAALGEPVGWRFGDFVELVQLTPQTETAVAGEALPVEVCWRPLRQTAQEMTMLLHLIGPDNGVIADRYTYPGLGSYPTTIWAPGAVFCDTVRLPIPADLAQTQLYHLVPGWLDAQGQRLPVQDGRGNPVAYPLAGVVRLETAVAPPIPAATPAGSGPIRLLAADFAPVWAAGETIPLHFQWWAAAPVTADYTLFIHLVEAESDHLAAQADGPPRQGWYPTSRWTAGETVADTHLFPLPAEMPAGIYALRIGWYNPADGARLGEPYALGLVTVTGE